MRNLLIFILSLNLINPAFAHPEPTKMSRLITRQLADEVEGIKSNKEFIERLIPFETKEHRQILLAEMNRLQKFPKVEYLNEKIVIRLEKELVIEFAALDVVNGKYLINGEVYVHDLQKPLRTRLAEVQKILKKTLKVSEAQTLSLLPQAHALGFLVVLPALASIVMVFGVAGIGKMYYSCGIKNYQKITDILNGAISGIKALLSSDNPDCRPATEEERAAAQKKLKTNKTAQ